jgi:hypothetical protein
MDGSFSTPGHLGRQGSLTGSQRQALSEIKSILYNFQDVLIQDFFSHSQFLARAKILTLS